MATRGAIARKFMSTLIVIAAVAVSGRAADSPAKRDIDPKAKKVVDDWGKYISSLRGFRYDGTIDLTIEQPQRKQSQNVSVTLAAERPNKLLYTIETPPQGGATIAGDGSDLTVFIKAFNKYAVEKSPETWADLLKVPLVAGPLSFGNASVVTISLFDDKPADKLIEKVETLKYGGLVDLGGQKAHLIEASGGELDWQLWLSSGPQPALLQFVPDLVKTFARRAEAQGQKGKNAMADVKISNIVTYKNWQGDPKFSPDGFSANVPEGTEKAKSLMEIISGNARQAEPKPHVLLGQAAPEVKLELLGGGQLDLAELKGKVVILDFWATWCGPCVQAMPIIDKVAEKYKDKGVVLYAVNLREEPDDVKKFLEEAKLDVAVALDKDGEVGTAYKADAIPQTVLVGKDGSVQVVRIGLSPKLEEELQKDLDALVAGKNLAADTLKAYKDRKEAAAKADEAGGKDDEGDNKDGEKPATGKNAPKPAK